MIFHTTSFPTSRRTRNALNFKLENKLTISRQLVEVACKRKELQRVSVLSQQTNNAYICVSRCAVLDQAGKVARAGLPRVFGYAARATVSSCELDFTADVIDRK